MEYYFSQGNNSYLCSKEFQECAVFDSFGMLVSINNSISVGRNMVPVEVLSVLSTGSLSKECEIAFKGKKKVFNTTVTNAISELRKAGVYVGKLFSGNREEGGEKIIQMFIAYKVGEMSWLTIEKLFPGTLGVWEDF